MSNKNTLTTFEGFSLMTICFMFSAFNGSLSRLIQVCGNAGWIAMTAGAALSYGFFGLFYLLVRRHGCKSLLDISRDMLGNVGSKAVACLLLLYMLFFTVENLSEAADILISNTYAHFAPIAVCIGILSVVGVVALYPLKGLGRTLSVTIPIAFVSIAFILLMNYRDYDPTYLLPILGHGAGPLAQTSFFHLVAFDGLLVACVLGDSFESVKSYRKAGVWAVGAGNVVFIVSAVCYGMSGPYQANHMSQGGLMDLARAIYLNRFFQRFESIFIIFASLGKILVLCVGLAAMLKSFNFLFGIPPRYEKKPIFPLLALVLGGGMLLYNLPAFWTRFADFTLKANVFFILALLALLLLVGVFRGMGQPKRRFASLLLVCGLLAPILGGCAQVGEPDEEIFAIVMGYDKSDSETMRITMKIMPEDKKSAGGSGGGSFADEEGSVPNNVFAVDAPCNIPAADLINSVIPKNLSLLHVKMLVISEEMAREDIDLLLTSITRYNEIKPTVAVVICDGKAEDFIAARTSELIPFLPLETEMILKRDKQSANYLVQTMGDIYRTYQSTTGDAMAMYGGLTMDARAKKEEGENPAPEEQEEKPQSGDGQDMDGMDAGEGSGDTEAAKDTRQKEVPPSVEGQSGPEKSAGGNVPEVFYDDPDVGYLNGYLPGEVPITTAVESQIIGMAVFSENKMVGTLNSHETQMYMIADGSFSGSVLPVRDPNKPDYYIMFYANNRKPTRIRASIGEDGIADIDIEAYLRIKPMVVHNSDIDYQDPAEQEALHQYVLDYLEGELKDLIGKLQGEYEADSLRLGRYVAGSFLTNPEWENYNWREQYPNARIDISLDLKM